MTILVTGGAGFIGSAVVRRLIAEDCHKVVTLDKLAYASNLDNIRAELASAAHTLERVDLCERGAVDDVIRRHRPTLILHLAAESHVDRSIDDPGAFIQSNIVGTYNLLEAARAHWKTLDTDERHGVRFVHVSTDEVFGTLGPAGAFSETTPHAPNSPYSASKSSADMLARAWHRTFGVPVLISNCSNNYGPYQFPEKLIPVVILAALEGRPIPVYGNGQNIRDWLFVEDHVDALIRIARRGVPGETYTVGGRNEMTNLDLIRLLCRLLDELVPESAFAPHDKLITFVADRPGHDERYAIDASKIERELGWRPSVGVEEGMRKTVQWYLDNRWWWEAIRKRGFKGERIGLGTGTAQTSAV